MLGQSEIAKYFDQCDDNISIEEVLSAYIVWKFYRGSTPAGVLQKMHYLCCFLRATGRSHILQVGQNAFKVLTVEVAIGGGRVGVLPAYTKPGLAAWNALRQAASRPSLFGISNSNKRTIVTTDQVYGGPGPVLSVLSRRPSASASTSSSAPDQSDTIDSPNLSRPLHVATGNAALDRATPPEERPPWADRYFYTRRQFGHDDYASDASRALLPDYRSDRGTLPVYVSRELAEGLESMARVLSESQHDGQHDGFEGEGVVHEASTGQGNHGAIMA